MGARLILTARKADELAEAQQHLKGLGIEAQVIANDLSQFEQIPGLVDKALAAYGQIDILVNNAGANWAAPAEDYPDEAWHKVMNLNVTAPFFLTREVGKRAMIPRQQGKVINIASVAGLKGNSPGVTMVAYNTSKAASVNMTRALASEWGRYNINVNAICPGFFPTKMTHGLLEKIGDSVVARAPLHRLGGEEDLKGSIVFLASEASRHITGHALPVDGGSIIT
jgi:gluconate 5-dehydrogenase